MHLVLALTLDATSVRTTTALGAFKCSEITVSGEKREVFKDSVIGPCFGLFGGCGNVTEEDDMPGFWGSWVTSSTRF